MVVRQRQRRSLGAVVCILMMLACLVACAPQRQWSKAGINQTQFDVDAASCRKEATRATYLDPYGFEAGQDQGMERAVVQERVFERCMTAKGYRLKDSDSSR